MNGDQVGRLGLKLMMDNPQVRSRKSFVVGGRPWASSPTIPGIPDDRHSASGGDVDAAAFERLQSIVAPNTDLVRNENTRLDLATFTMRSGNLASMPSSRETGSC